MKKVIFACICALYVNYADAVKIQSIDFCGLQTVASDVAASCIEVKKGDDVCDEEFDDLLRTLYASGLFSEVKLSIVEGGKLLINVVENPMIDEIAFEGNKIVKDSVFNQFFMEKFSHGKLFSMELLRDVTNDIGQFYKASGCYTVHISPKIIKKPQNKVDVVFEINEGEPTKVRRILFIGNKAFGEDTLKDEIVTKQDCFWRFWDGEASIFREDRLEEDISLLRNFYNNNGYPNFEVKTVVSEISYDKKDYYITFVLQEGEKFNIKNVKVVSKVKDVNANDFLSEIGITSGELLNSAKCNECKEEILRKISESGICFVGVTQKVSLNDEDKTADIEFSIIPQEKCFVERIDIRGNSRTFDEVLRREFRTHEGDPYDGYRIKKAVNNLQRCGLFEDVNCREFNGQSEDMVVLGVNVREKDSNSSIKFGVTVESTDGIGGFGGFSDRNFGGRGRTLSVDGLFTKRYQNIECSLYEPSFMNKDIGAGITLSGFNRNRKKEDHSITKGFGVSPFFRYRVSENVSHRVGISYYNNNKKFKRDGKCNVGGHCGTGVLQGEYGHYSLVELSSVLSYDQVDSVYNPQKGYSVFLNNTYAGLLGNVKFLKNSVGVRYYRPVTEKVTFSLDGEVGIMKEFKNGKSSYRYTLGGDGRSMRGFESAGIGPRDKNNDDSIGGLKFWTTSFVLKAPLSTKEVGINGVMFVDVGSAWGVKNDWKNHVYDDSSVRVSAGFAIEWENSPLGCPLTFVFGFPIKKKSFDKKQTFTLTGFI